MTGDRLVCHLKSALIFTPLTRNTSRHYRYALTRFPYLTPVRYQIVRERNTTWIFMLSLRADKISIHQDAAFFFFFFPSSECAVKFSDTILRFWRSHQSESTILVGLSHPPYSRHHTSCHLQHQMGILALLFCSVLYMDSFLVSSKQ